MRAGDAIPSELAERNHESHLRLRAFGQRDVDELLALLRAAARVDCVAGVNADDAAATGFVVALRHDVDHDLDNAVRFAELEHELGIRSTYFLLHTDWYYRNGDSGPPAPSLLEASTRIADLGHEIALHNNIIAAALRLGVNPAELLEQELAWLRDAGLEIRGTVAHGDPLCHKVGFVNYELFRETPFPKAGPPQREIVFVDDETGSERRLRLRPVSMADFGLQYEANFVSRTHYASDSGGVWRPTLAELANALRDGNVAQILAHPVWWALSGEPHTPRKAMSRSNSRLVHMLYGDDEPPPVSAASRNPALMTPQAQESTESRETTSGQDEDRELAQATSGEGSYSELYRRGGFGYAKDRAKWLTWSQQHYIDAFGLSPDESLLDVGCGDGFWTSIFAENGFDATGVDLNEEAIDIARRLYPQAAFLVRNAERPLFDDGRQFGIVFCRAISHLCAKNLMNPKTLAVIANMAACVAPGGVLLLSYWTLRDRSNQRTCADHTVSDLCMLLEPWLDPLAFGLTGNYVQISAQRRDAPR